MFWRKKTPIEVSPSSLERYGKNDLWVWLCLRKSIDAALALRRAGWLAKSAYSHLKADGIDLDIVERALLESVTRTFGDAFCQIAEKGQLFENQEFSGGRVVDVSSYIFGVENARTRPNTPTYQHRYVDGELLINIDTGAVYVLSNYMPWFISFENARLVLSAARITPKSFSAYGVVGPAKPPARDLPETKEFIPAESILKKVSATYPLIRAEPNIIPDITEAVKAEPFVMLSFAEAVSMIAALDKLDNVVVELEPEPIDSDLFESELSQKLESQDPEEEPMHVVLGLTEETEEKYMTESDLGNKSKLETKSESEDEDFYDSPPAMDEIEIDDDAFDDNEGWNNQS